MSERASLSSPRTCSGDMYWSVPTMCPWRVRRLDPKARAMPKSITFTTPSEFSMMFEPLMSRCTMRSSA
jgi:hypothetical protein